MHRFFTEPTCIGADEIRIEGEDFKHITKVLRLRAEEPIEICDGRGTDHIAVIASVEKDVLTARIVERKPSRGENTQTAVTLFQGVPKGQKMESVIQKCVEAGAVAIVPFTSRRTVVQMKDKKEKKTQRWQRVAYEAAKQSKRGIIPQVEEALGFGGLLERLAAYDLVLMAYEGEVETRLKKVLETAGTDAKKVAIIVGPEGGFSEEEARAIEGAGGYSVSLGNRILRTETAGVVMLSQINFFYDE